MLARGEGARVWDADGHEYVDYLLAPGRSSSATAIRAWSRPCSARRGGLDLLRPERADRRLAEGSSSRSVRGARAVLRSRAAEATSTRCAWRAPRRGATGAEVRGRLHGSTTTRSHEPLRASARRRSGAGAGRPPASRAPSSTTSWSRRSTTWQRPRPSSRRTPTGWPAIIVEPLQRVIEPLPGFLEGLRALARAPRIPARLRRDRDRLPPRPRRRAGALRRRA